MEMFLVAALVFVTTIVAYLSGKWESSRRIEHLEKTIDEYETEIDTLNKKVKMLRDARKES